MADRELMRLLGRWWFLLVLSVVAAVLTPLGAATAAAPSCSNAGLTVTALHGPRFYTDLSITPVLRGAYAGYRVADTSGGARTNLWVELSGFTGGSVALGGGQPAAQQVASLPAGGAASRFWYLTAATESPARQDHTVTVWQGRPDLPGSTALCTAGGGFTSVDGTIKAAANKLTSVVVAGGTPTVGSTFTVTVKGDTGTIGSGIADDPASFWMSPSALGTWPASAYRLEHTSLQLAGATHTDVLRVANLASGGAYTAVYTFRAVGFTSSATDVLPVQQIASGTQIKHTDTGSAGSLPAIPRTTNSMTVATSAAPSTLPVDGGTVHVTVELDGTDGATLDDVTDQLPSGAALIPGTARWHGTGTGDPTVAGDRLVFQGPFTLGPGPDLLTFDLRLAGRPGEHVNAVRAHVGDAVLDATTDLTDDAPATSTVTVDTPPVAVDEAVAAYAGDPVTVHVLANDRDADSDTLDLAAVSAPAHGTATASGGDIVYVADPAFQGQDTFAYTVSDGRGGTDTGTVTVQVTNAPPAHAADDTVELQPGETTTLDVLGNDTGAGLRITSVVGLDATTSTDGRGVVVTAPTTAGTHTLRYTVADRAGNTETATVTITVPLPPAPVAGDDDVELQPGETASLDVLGNDTGTELRIVSVTGPAEVSGDGTRVLVIAPQEPGAHVVRYTVEDSFGRRHEATVSVTVLEPSMPAPPAAADDELVVRAGRSGEVDVLLNDSGTEPSVTGITTPEHGVADLRGSTVTYQPARDFVGRDSVGYTVVDRFGRTAQASVDVRVEEAPAGRPDAVVTDWNRAVTSDVLLNDPEGSEIAEVTTAPEHGRVTLAPDGSLTYQPERRFAGTDSLTYRLVGSRQPVAVTVDVGAPALALADDTVTTTRPQGRISVPVLGNDTGTGLHVVDVSAPEHGGARVDAAGRVLYVPASDHTGPVTFQYVVEDVVGHRATATVTVRVLNLEPTLEQFDTVRAVAGDQVRVVARTDDPDGDRLRVGLGTPRGTGGDHPAAEAIPRARTGDPSDGTATLELRLSEEFTGHLVVPVRVEDGQGGTATRGLRVDVVPQPAVGLSAAVLDNSGARRALRHPSFEDGRPQSRMLSTSVDTRVSWKRSPTDSVRRYEVRVDGDVACTVAATEEPRQDCRLQDRVLERGAAVNVRAVGSEGLASEPDRVEVSTDEEGHLLAVVYFPSGEFFLDASAQRTLAALARNADAAGYGTVTMLGHTDSDGSLSSNATLSRDRAREVRQYVVAHFDAIRVASTGGYGETRPAMSNRTELGKAANRRVEIYVGW